MNTVFLFTDPVWVDTRISFCGIAAKPQRTVDLSSHSTIRCIPKVHGIQVIANKSTMSTSHNTKINKYSQQKIILQSEIIHRKNHSSINKNSHPATQQASHDYTPLWSGHNTQEINHQVFKLQCALHSLPVIWLLGLPRLRTFQNVTFLELFLDPFQVFFASAHRNFHVEGKSNGEMIG